MTYEWADLSDSELRARLVNRGCPVDVAYSLVRHRDRSHRDREIIAEVLA